MRLTTIKKFHSDGVIRLVWAGLDGTPTDDIVQAHELPADVLKAGVTDKDDQGFHMDGGGFERVAPCETLSQAINARIRVIEAKKNKKLEVGNAKS